MKRQTKILGLFGAVAILVAMAVGHFGAPKGAFALGPAGSSGVLHQLSDDIAAVAEKARPAVVSVQATAVKKVQVENPLEPFEQFFGPEFRQRFAPNLPKDFEYRQRGIGSGFIIDSDGIILTNNHVVADSDELKVIMNDGKEYKAKVLGRDPDTEVAVLKIDAKGLPTVEMGDSDQLKIGNLVIAIGSPLGLEFNQTVTMGIVSALKRAVGITTYDNFIQTDAAINLGNSGGPLLDVDGRVVGINTAIVSRPGGAEGLGLAIPINEARKVADVLRKGRKMQRGYLGLMGSDLSPVTAPDVANYMRTGNRTGIIVTMVSPGTPAESSGLKVGDAIVELNGESIANYDDFRRKIGAIPPNETVGLKAIRDGKELTIKAKLAQRPSREELAAGKTGGGPAAEEQETKLDLGFSIRSLTPDAAQTLGYQGKKGVVVTQVNSTSEAARQGIRPKMLVTEINRTKVENVEQFKKAVEAGKNMKSVFLLVEGEGEGPRLIILPKE
jgi:serine protease Do